MKIFLNVYDYPADAQTLAAVKRLGYDGVRRDVPDPNYIPSILEEGSAAKLETLLLLNATPSVCRYWAPMLGSFPPGQMVEVGNEWDTKHTAADAKDAWLECLKYLGQRMITGGISSLGNAPLKWLEKAWDPSFPNLGFHPYRTTEPPDSGVMERIQQLRRIAPAAKLWNTECGWHTCKSKKSCFRSVQFSEEQVAQFLKEDIGYHEKAFCESYTVYQLNDGPGDCVSYENHFGIRRVDGTWKPSAYILEA
jgi:hypothetical protein